MEDKRLDYLDIAKGIGILLVVLGHIYGNNNVFHVWIYSFHMPLFYFILFQELHLEQINIMM